MTPTPFTLPYVESVLSRPCPELVGGLRAAIPAVVERHLGELKAQLKSCVGLSDAGILDDLPVVLDTFANHLGQKDCAAAIHRCGPAHAAARDGQHFSEQEIFEEYVLLRRNLLETVTVQLGRDISAVEREVLQAGLDTLLAAIVGSFFHLRIAREQLTSNALADFASALAHEVRNEVGGLVTTLTLFEEAASHDGAGRTAPVESLPWRQEVSRCRETVESTIAALSRLLEADRVQRPVAIEARETLLAPLLDGIARSADRTARVLGRFRGERSLSRIVTTCPEQLVIVTDPDLVATVLSNLVGNAVKYAPHGPIELSAKMEAAGCRISVGDHGPGLTEAEVARIFSRFERAEKSVPGSGMGLGLYIARRAAELLGGTLSVESSAGHGSCFSLTLPARE